MNEKRILIADNDFYSQQRSPATEDWPEFLNAAMVAEAPATEDWPEFLNAAMVAEEIARLRKVLELLVPIMDKMEKSLRRVGM